MFALHLNIKPQSKMKKLKLILLSSLFVAALSSCSHEPKACFTVDVDANSTGSYVKSSKGKVGDRFYFSSLCSEHNFTSATIFEYGDGTTGSEEGHEYTKPGTYTVKCKVFAVDHGKKGDKSAEFTQAITVLPSQTQAGL